MKLNIDILIDNLSEIFSVQHYGYYSKEMSLSLRQYYDGTSKFESNRLYIVSADLLPDNPILEKGSVIICCNGEPSRAYFSPQCTLLLLQTDKNVPSIFNIISMIFEKYDNWDSDLQKISGSIEKNTLNDLLRFSLPIFQNTLFITDNHLKLIAKISPPNSKSKLYKFKTNDCVSPSVEHYSSYYKKHITSDRKIREVYLSDAFTPTLCIHLYEQETYLGTCHIQTDLNPLKESDKALLKHLSLYVNVVCKEYQSIKETDSIQKELFIQSINGTLKENQQFIKLPYPTQQKLESYICIVCKSAGDIQFLPTKYICKKIESHLSGTLAIEKENMIVLLVNFNMTSLSKEITIQEVTAILDNLGFKGGISNEFESLKFSYNHYIQAREALEIGALLKPESSIYYFQDYLTEYMLNMIIRELPISMLCKYGINQLIQHDKINNTNYFEELRIYLKNNLNAVRTANECFIHRHTLYSHLKQINDIIQLDLENSNDILYLHIIYKLLELEGSRS